MACSNSNCPNKSKGPTPVDKLGECEACHEARLSVIRSNLSKLPSKVIAWFEQAESNYGKNCFYSSDLEKIIDAKNATKLQELGIADLKFGAKIKLASDGKADSFITTAKNFTLMETIKPSAAIRSFVNGRLTVCECEGMIKAVIFNALCDLVGDDVFDVAFSNWRSMARAGV